MQPATHRATQVKQLVDPGQLELTKAHTVIRIVLYKTSGASAKKCHWATEDMCHHVSQVKSSQDSENGSRRHVIMVPASGSLSNK